jgi:DNA-binding NarL/FixJ family response regulator
MLPGVRLHSLFLKELPKVSAAPAFHSAARSGESPASQHQQRDYAVMKDRPRVVVADDHRAMLDTLVQMLSSEFEVVAAVTDGLSVVAAASQFEPDLLVLDIAMPGLNGIAAASRVRNSGSTAKVVFVTNLRDREFVQESLALGEVGFVIKSRLVADLLPAIHSVLAGQSFISMSVTH